MSVAGSPCRHQCTCLAPSSKPITLLSLYLSGFHLHGKKLIQICKLCNPDVRFPRREQQWKGLSFLGHINTYVFGYLPIAKIPATTSEWPFGAFSGLRGGKELGHQEQEQVWASRPFYVGWTKVLSPSEPLSLAPVFAYLRLLVLSLFLM